MKDRYRKVYYENDEWYFESDNTDTQLASVSLLDKGIDITYLRKCTKSYYISYEITFEKVVIDHEKF